VSAGPARSTPAPVRRGPDADTPRPTLPSNAPGPVRTASLGVVKAATALLLMAVFFTLFLIAPGPTAAGALLVIVLFELARRR
jgi:hypothetical protein